MAVKIFTFIKPHGAPKPQLLVDKLSLDFSKASILVKSNVIPGSIGKDGSFRFQIVETVIPAKSHFCFAGKFIQIKISLCMMQ